MVAGEWRWVDDRFIQFRPEEDWPAGRRFTVNIDRSALADTIRLDVYRRSFVTPEFEAELERLEFYQAPESTGAKAVYATIGFTHPVVKKDLEKRVKFEVLGDEELYSDTPAARRFQLDLDKHHRRAYIRSVPLSVPEREVFMRVTVGSGVNRSQKRHDLRAG